jgi:DNA-binding SARP family transcriptional activator
MQFRILGTVEVRTPQGWTEIGATKWRNLLSVLLLNHNRPVTTDDLITELWPDDVPAGARKLINLYVLRLRRLLGDPDGRVLATKRHSAYALHLAPGDLDARLFESQVADARQAWNDGAAVTARILLATALDLWRGPALSDVTAPAATVAAQRLEEQRVSALGLRIDADLACGRHPEVVSELWALLAAHPLHEPFWAQQMRALRSAGRDAEALQAYGQARHTIARELGADPGQELQRLGQALLKGQDFEPRGVPSAIEMAPERALRIRQLPPDAADFTGRDASISRLMSSLSPAGGRRFTPVAMICGIPGVGKTSLAVHVAHRLRQMFPDGQLYIRLGGAASSARDPHDVLGELLRALAVPSSDIPASTHERSATFRSILDGRKALLLADDAATADQITPLLPGNPQCAVLVTSRTMLTTIPGADVLRLEPLAPDEAIEMLCRIAGPGRVAAQRRPADQLVSACAYLPLAIRIAGARLAARPSWPIAHLADQLTDGHTRIAALSTTGLDARASFSLSYDALPDTAQQAFRLISLLNSSDFPEWSVAALLDKNAAHETTELLTDKCILNPLGVDSTGQPRYAINGLLRDYAAERLRACGDDGDAALKRAATGWAELAHHASRVLRPDLYYPPLKRVPGHVIISPRLTRQLTLNPFGWFTAESANLVNMAERACATGMLDLANQLLAFQSAYHFYHGRLDDHERLVRLLADTAAAAGRRSEVADAKLRLAGLTALRRGYSHAAPMFEQVIEDLRKDADLHLLASGLYWYSYCALKTGNVHPARDIARQAVEISHRLGDHETGIMARRVLGEAHLGAGQHESAIAEISQAFTAAQELSDPYYHLFMIRVAAHIAIRLRRLSDAKELCKQGLGLAHEHQLPAIGAHFTCLLGVTHHHLEEQAQAAYMLAEASTIFDIYGDIRGDARCKLSLAQVHRATGNYKLAMSYLDECLPSFRRLLLPAYEKQAIKELEVCQAALGRSPY